MFLGVASQEIFWGNLYKIWPMARNQSSSEFKRILDGNKIFKKILDENALEYLAFGGGFYYGSPTARHLNYNLEQNL